MPVRRAELLASERRRGGGAAGAGGRLERAASLRGPHYTGARVFARGQRVDDSPEGGRRGCDVVVTEVMLLLLVVVTVP